MEATQLDLLIKIGAGALLGTILAATIAASAQITVSRLNSRHDRKKERRARELALLDDVAREFEDIHSRLTRALHSFLDASLAPEGQEPGNPERQLANFFRQYQGLGSIEVRLRLVSAKGPTAAVAAYRSAFGDAAKKLVTGQIAKDHNLLVSTCGSLVIDLNQEHDRVLLAMASFYKALWR